MSALRLIGLLLAINVALVIVGAVATKPPAPRAGTGLRVGLVFDVGGKNDGSFNTTAWRGVQRAEKELGVEVTLLEPSEGADRKTALRTLAARGLDLVIGVGFIFSGDVEELAREFPDVKFACVDYSASEGVGTIPNLVGLKFREQEGAFLVGAIAGMVTRTKAVGFVGGMKIPLIRKFQAGYEAGVKHVCPECRVFGAYAGTDPKAFADPSTGEQLASAQYDQDADIIFHAAGKTGDGVFAAARARDLFAIGVDSDQFAAAPCCILTSMVKRVDVAVVEVVRELAEKRFRGGLRELGLAEDGLGFVANEHNAALLPIDVVTKARALREQIIRGEIRPPEQ